MCKYIMHILSFHIYMNINIHTQIYKNTKGLSFFFFGERTLGLVGWRKVVLFICQSPGCPVALSERLNRRVRVRARVCEPREH